MVHSSGVSIPLHIERKQRIIPDFFERRGDGALRDDLQLKKYN